VLLSVLLFGNYAMGQLRDRIFAQTFGAGSELDAYNAAFVLPELLLDVLIAREHTDSTAIGDGIAMPHVRQPVVAPGAAAMLIVCHLAAPVPFGAIDQVPVKCVLLIVSPTIRTHLQMLAHLARALQDDGFRAALDRRAAAAELADQAARLEVAPVLPPAASDEAVD